MRRIAPKATHRGAGNVVVVQGCHDAFALSFRDKRFTSAILTCHYPIRSLHQFRSKVRNAGSDYAINRELPRCVGDRFRYWYALPQQGELDDEYRDVQYRGPDLLRERLASGEVLEDTRLATSLRPAQLAVRA